MMLVVTGQLSHEARLTFLDSFFTPRKGVECKSYIFEKLNSIN